MQMSETDIKATEMCGSCNSFYGILWQSMLVPASQAWHPRSARLVGERNELALDGSFHSLTCVLFTIGSFVNKHGLVTNALVASKSGL